MATTSKWEGLIITTSTTTIISYKSITTYVYYYYYNVSVAITYITDTISTIVILLLVKLNFYFYCPYVYLLDLLEHNVKVPPFRWFKSKLWYLTVVVVIVVVKFDICCAFAAAKGDAKLGSTFVIQALGR